MSNQGVFDGFGTVSKGIRGKLQERFIVPPFSILDTRQGYWQERKELWIDLGIEAELGKTSGRADNLLGSSAWDGSWVKEKLGDDCKDLAVNASGTSLFDPVLTEIVYRWFCPSKGVILDPFAGGAVRGIVASMLGYKYYGIDLCKEQIDENIKKGVQLVPNNMPIWYYGDSNNLVDILPQNSEYDLIFSCPPYFDLEKYTDDPRDLSNAYDWNEFCEAYTNIIENSTKLLKNNRFAVFVLSEIRNRKGNYYGLINKTIDTFTNCDLVYYNEIVFINQCGSLPIRVSRQFSSTRKVGRVHQNVLVFFKGDISKINSIYKEIDTAIGD